VRVRGWGKKGRVGMKMEGDGVLRRMHSCKVKREGREGGAGLKRAGGLQREKEKCLGG